MQPLTLVFHRIGLYLRMVRAVNSDSYIKRDKKLRAILLGFKVLNILHRVVDSGGLRLRLPHRCESLVGDELYLTACFDGSR